MRLFKNKQTNSNIGVPVRVVIVDELLWYKRNEALWVVHVTLFIASPCRKDRDEYNYFKQVEYIIVVIHSAPPCRSERRREF